MNKSVLSKMYSSAGNVELSEVKVDLGLVEDINTMTQKAKQIATELGNAVNAADKLKLEFDKQVAIVKKAYPVASKYQDSEDKIWERAQKAAADLGLKREDIKGWKEFTDTGIDVNSAINGANKYML